MERVTRRPAAAALALVACAAGALLPATPPAAGGPVQGDALGMAVAAAMEAQPGLVTAASYTVRPALAPLASGTKDSAAGPFFPTEGASFGILTTGDLAAVDDPNQGSFYSAVAGGPGMDMTTLAVSVEVPAQHNVLAFDLQFLSEEYPEYVGSLFNDALLAQLDVPVHVAAAGEVVAPGNFATDDNGNPITVNQASVTAQNAAGTAYDGGTCRITAYTAASPGPHVLYITIFDNTDPFFDSAVFLDNLRTFRSPDVPKTACNPPPPEIEVAGGSLTVCDVVLFNVTQPPQVEGSTYEWDFGDGTKGEGNPAEHRYAEEGTYTATVTVYDPVTGMRVTGTRTVTITGCDLVAVVDDQKGYVGVPLTVPGKAVGGSGEYTCAWIIAGPWTAKEAPDKSCSPTIEYSEEGRYAVRLRVHDVVGGVDAVDYANLTIGPRPPGVSNEEPAPSAAPADGESGEAGGDADGDGVPNRDDRCPLGPDGSDLDGDGAPDACDGDADGDGWADPDLCPREADDGMDLDSDGVGDACDEDDDSDGVADVDDACPRSGDASCEAAFPAAGAGPKVRPEPVDATLAAPASRGPPSQAPWALAGLAGALALALAATLLVRRR